MSKNLIVINNDTLERTEVNLSVQFPNSRFYLSSGTTPSLNVKEFVENKVVPDPEGRVHTAELYKAFNEYYKGKVHNGTLAKELKEVLNRLGGVKKVVSIKGVKLQGYAGVRLK